MIMPGYIMIDCGGIDLTSAAAQSVPTLYTRCQAAMATHKPIIAYNLKWGDKDITPISAFLIQYTNTKIIATASTLQVHVTSEDVVSIVNLVS